MTPKILLFGFVFAALALGPQAFAEDAPPSDSAASTGVPKNSCGWYLDSAFLPEACVYGSDKLPNVEAMMLASQYEVYKLALAEFLKAKSAASGLNSSREQTVALANAEAVLLKMIHKACFAAADACAGACAKEPDIKLQERCEKVASLAADLKSQSEESRRKAKGQESARPLSTAQPAK